RCVRASLSPPTDGTRFGAPPVRPPRGGWPGRRRRIGGMRAQPHSAPPPGRAVTKVPLAKHDHMVKAFLSDRSNEPLRTRRSATATVVRLVDPVCPSLAAGSERCGHRRDPGREQCSAALVATHAPRSVGGQSIPPAKPNRDLAPLDERLR